MLQDIMDTQIDQVEQHSMSVSGDDAQQSCPVHVPLEEPAASAEEPAAASSPEEPATAAVLGNPAAAGRARTQSVRMLEADIQKTRTRRPRDPGSEPAPRSQPAARLYPRKRPGKSKRCPRLHPLKSVDRSAEAASSGESAWGPESAEAYTQLQETAR